MVKLPLDLLAGHMQDMTSMKDLKPLGIIFDLEAKRCVGAGAGYSMRICCTQNEHAGSILAASVIKRVRQRL